MKKILLACLLAITAVPCRAETKIISLMPAFTEILFAIGASTQVAGIGNFCDWPPEAAKLPRMGDLLAPDMEKIAAAKPDAIIIGKWKSSPTGERLRNAGFTVRELPDAESIEGIYANITAVGEIAGRRTEAAALVAKMKKELAAIGKLPGGKRPAVYAEIDAKHWTTGGGTFLSDIIEKAGGRNVFAGKKGFFQVSWEDIVRANPDIIVDLSYARTDFSKLPGAKGITAVKNNAILTGLDKNLLTRPGPRAVEAVRTMRSAISENRR